MIEPEMADWLFDRQPAERSRQLFPRFHTQEVRDHFLGPSMRIWQRVVEQGEILTVAWCRFPKLADGQRGQSLDKILHPISIFTK